jgi:integrase
MTNPLTTPESHSLPMAGVALTVDDAEHIAAAVEAELAPGTQAMYAGSWRVWERWCQGRSIAPLPAPPEALAAFLAERATTGLTFGTLDAYCSGIAHRHHQEGLADPTADFLVRRVRRGLRWIMGVAPRRQAHPLTVVELGQVVDAIDLDNFTGVRDRAILLVGYAAAMRPGEISALDVDDIVRKPTGALIRIRRSKTDQDARGQLIGIARGEHADTDPIRALDAWLKVRPRGTGPPVHARPLAQPPDPRPDGTTRDQPDRPTARERSRIRRRPRHRTLTPRRATQRRPRSMARRSTASQPRPATATSAPCSTTTSDPPKR